MPKKYELKIGVKRTWLTTTYDHQHALSNKKDKDIP